MLRLKCGSCRNLIFIQDIDQPPWTLDPHVSWIFFQFNTFYRGVMNKKTFKLLTAETGLDDFHYLFTCQVAEVLFKQHIKVFIYTSDS